MAQLCRGRIVWVELLDPQGRNPKCRPAVIVSPDADIHEEGEVDVVGISTQLAEASREDQVELPWERRGHPKTGLNARCAAICSWKAKVSVADIEESAGIVPGRQLLEILTRIKPPDQCDEPAASPS